MKQRIKILLLAVLLIGLPACTTIKEEPSPPSVQGAGCESQSTEVIANLEKQLLDKGVTVWQIFTSNAQSTVDTIWQIISDKTNVVFPWMISGSEIPDKVHIIGSRYVPQVMILAAKNGCHLGGMAVPREIINFLPMDELELYMRQYVTAHSTYKI